MLLVIDSLFDADEVQAMRERLAGAAWQPGVATAGELAREVKHNEQVPAQDETGRALGEGLLRRLAAHPRFMSAALPARIHPPRFNRYRGGGHYGTHVDGAVMPLPDGSLLRADLSATLFLTPLEAYDGGELEIETAFGAQAVKLAPGDLVLYPARSLHRVAPVTRGERIAAFFWVQSLVRDDAARELLFDLDEAIRSLRARDAAAPEVLSLSAIYHNLLRRWVAP